jgi:imidazolonepropionase-like amidohydrolase
MTCLTKIACASAFVLVAFAALAQEDSSPAQTLFINVNVFDGTSDQLAMGMNVLVEDNLIKSVSAEDIHAAGATVIDGGGRTLMPGMIDMHAHLCLRDGMLTFRDNYDQMMAGANTAHVLLDYLDQGFTTARDAGCNVLSVAKGVNNGLIPGPRIFPSGGFLSQTGGHADTGYFNESLHFVDTLQQANFGYIVDGPAEVMKAARHNLRAGATQLKIMAGGGVASEFDPLHMTQFTIEEMQAAVQIAADYGTYVLAHAYHDASVNRAIDAGVRVIEHNFLVSEKTIERMKTEGVALSVQAVVALVQFGDPDSITFFSPDQKAKAKQVNSGALQMMKWAVKHNLLMVTGGDMFGPYVFSQADNVIKFNEVTEDTFLTLKTATSNAGEVLSWSGGMNPYKYGTLGTIAEGGYADIILINGNPLENIKLISREYVAFVMKDGVIYKNTLSAASPASPDENEATIRTRLTIDGRIAIYGVQFTTDSADLIEGSERTLAIIAAVLKASPDVKIAVVGHTDNEGGHDHNLELSKLRADAVVAELIEKYGIAGDRLFAAGASFLSPIASNDNEEGRALNRRVELVRVK